MAKCHDHTPCIYLSLIAMLHKYDVYSQVFDIKGKEHIKAARYKYLTFTMLSQMHESNAIDLIDIPITVGAMAYVINALSYIVT